MLSFSFDIYNILYFSAFPEWVEHINDTEVDIGSDLYWPCVATGKPIPTIRWLKNGYAVCMFGCCAVLKSVFRQHFQGSWDKFNRVRVPGP